MKFIILLFCFQSFANAAVIENLQLGGFIWPPLQLNHETDYGVGGNLLKAIYKRANYNVKINYYPWARTQHLVKNGNLDGLSLVWYTDERAKYVYYSKPIIQTEIVIIKRRDYPFVFNEARDLHGKHVGALRGFGYYDLIKSNKIQKTLVKNLRQNFMKLYRGRIDLTIASRISAVKVLDQLPPEIRNGLIIVKKPLKLKMLHTTISKFKPNHLEIINRFNVALEEMKKDGTYRKFIEQSSPKPLGVYK